jgi:hypothetical protein
MGRMGRAYYVRASGEAIHTIHQPVLAKPIGWDGLPEFITHHHELTGNEIAEIAALEKFPSEEDISRYLIRNSKILHTTEFIPHVKQLLRNGDAAEAFGLLIADKEKQGG